MIGYVPYFDVIEKPIGLETFIYAWLRKRPDSGDCAKIYFNAEDIIARSWDGLICVRKGIVIELV